MKGQMTIIIITHREALLAVADEVYEWIAHAGKERPLRKQSCLGKLIVC